MFTYLEHVFLAIIFPLFNGLDDLAEELYEIGREACPLHQKCVRSSLLPTLPLLYLPLPLIEDLTIQ